jgi:hypothetical protein
LLSPGRYPRSQRFRRGSVQVKLSEFGSEIHAGSLHKLARVYNQKE